MAFTVGTISPPLIPFHLEISLMRDFAYKIMEGPSNPHGSPNIECWNVQDGVFTISVHRFNGPDLTGMVHDHGCDSVSYCLEGGMTEEYLENGEWQRRYIQAGDAIFRPASCLHRMPLYEGETGLTIYFAYPVERSAGYYTRDGMIKVYGN
jgi:hypothetical protein